MHVPFLWAALSLVTNETMWSCDLLRTSCDYAMGKMNWFFRDVTHLCDYGNLSSPQQCSRCFTQCSDAIVAYELVSTSVSLFMRWQLVASTNQCPGLILAYFDDCSDRRAGECCDTWVHWARCECFDTTDCCAPQCLQCNAIYIHIYIYIYTYSCAGHLAWRCHNSIHKAVQGIWANACPCTSDTPEDLRMHKYTYIHRCINWCMYRLLHVSCVDVCRFHV